jgi:hypothetical protein
MSRSAERNGAFWVTPAVGVVAAVAFLVAGWLGGHPGVGAAAAVIMLVFSGGVVLAARRSETVQGLLDRRDERLVSIDLKATAVAGLATIVAICVGAFVELARGHSGAPFTWLGAIGGVAYLVAVTALRIRR